MKEWAEVYPELVNKFRWALQSSLSEGSTKYDYRASQVLATVLSQDAIAVVKCATSAPGVLASTKTVRGFFQQTELDKQLNSG